MVKENHIEMEKIFEKLSKETQTHLLSLASMALIAKNAVLEELKERGIKETVKDNSDSQKLLFSELSMEKKLDIISDFKYGARITVYEVFAVMSFLYEKRWKYKGAGGCLDIMRKIGHRKNIKFSYVATHEEFTKYLIDNHREQLIISRNKRCKFKDIYELLALAREYCDENGWQLSFL